MIADPQAGGDAGAGSTGGATSEMRHHGFCTLCRSRCGAIYVVADGRIREVLPDPDHPTGGALCAKGRAAPEMLADRDRLTTPLRRTRPKGDPDPGWEPISWDEALEAIAGRLSEIRDRQGARAMLFCSTTPSGTAIGDSFEWIDAFIRAYGSPHFVAAIEICNFQKDFGQALTTGGPLGAPDYANADAIVLWGHNPARTWLAASSLIGARADDVPLVVIDPQREGSGRKADLWLGLVPGSDGALAMSGIRHLIASEAYDEAFVRDWTDAALLVDRSSGEKLRAADIDLADAGFVAMTRDGPVAIDTMRAPDATLQLNLRFSGKVAGRDCDSALGLLAAQAEPWTVEATAAVTGLDSEAIRRFHALLASDAHIAHNHWSGLSQSDRASQTVRAIGCLFALRGDVDRAGSNRWFASPPVQPFEARLSGEPLGHERLPLGPPRYGFVTLRDALEAIETGRPYPIGGLMSFGTNPTGSYPDPRRTAAALERLDFHVHCDLRMTPMADSADFLLPVTLPWEHDSLRPGFDLDERAASHVQLRRAVVAPSGDQRPDYAIVRELAQRLGFSDPLWHGSIDEAWNHRLAPSGLDVAALDAQPQGITLSLNHPTAAYSLPDGAGGVRGFATPSRRIELHSGRLAAVGQAAVPSWTPPAAPDPEFPLLLTTSKPVVFTQSSLRYVPSLAQRATAPEVGLSPATASAVDISAGDWCRILTQFGDIAMRARIDDNLSNGVLVADHGWWVEADAGDALMTSTNLNSILRNGRDDPISGSVQLRRISCRIEKDHERSRGLWQGRRPFHVTNRIDHPFAIVELVLEPDDGGQAPSFAAGQHVALSVPGIDLERHYSLVSCGRTSSERLAIAIRRARAGGLSDHIHASLRPGASVTLTPPGGRFRLPLYSSRPLLLIAGGIGITPFLGYLRTLATLGSDRLPAVRLVYASRDDAFEEELRQIDLPRFAYRRLLSGRTIAGAVADAGIDLDSRVFLCGPGPFMQAARVALRDTGIADQAILEERFSANPPPTEGLTAATVTLGLSDRRFVWHPHQPSILAAAEAAGIRLASGCRAGECESCALPVTAGHVSHGRDAPEDGVCLTCCAVPIGDVTLAA